MLSLYNTLTREKQQFIPLEEGKVKMYVCGPTVYDKGHLGHGRSMVAFDVVRRYLTFSGYDVYFVSNYTDIDDKMINRAAEEGVTVADLAERISKEYDQDFAALSILPPHERPLSTEYVDETFVMVKKLLNEDIAYELEDGVYFDVTKFPEYGKLSKQKLGELQAGARVETVAGKRNHQDFVLWKHKKEGEPSWEDPEGILKEGRPGWHIECSAMTYGVLGESFDIHGGGADLTFPHHECEIAQSEACWGKQFVNYWLHNGYVQIDGEKMSKSLGNFFTLQDIFKDHDPLVVRFALLSTHYRGPIDFGPDLLHQAAASLQRIRDYVARLENFAVVDSGSDDQVDRLVSDLLAGFTEAMDDDLEVSRALAAVFEFVTQGNRLMDEGMLTEIGREAMLKALQQLDQVFACFFVDATDLQLEVKELAERREQARAEKDYALSDQLRDELLALGYSVEDGPAGQTVKKSLT